MQKFLIFHCGFALSTLTFNFLCTNSPILQFTNLSRIFLLGFTNSLNLNNRGNFIRVFHSANKPASKIRVVFNLFHYLAEVDKPVNHNLAQ